jgi:hypothetical protein
MLLTLDRRTGSVGAALLGVAVCCIMLCGCSCEKERSPTDPSKPPSPLELKEAPADLGVSIHPTIGATSAKPVTLVLGTDQALCDRAVARLTGRAHVLCTKAPPEVAEQKLRVALQFLKTTYPRHVGAPPVLLLASESHARVGWRLMLAEPGFFAHGYLEGLEAKVLTSVTMAALHQGFARTLVIQSNEDKRLKFLKNIAARRGLALHVLPQNRNTREEALTISIAAFLPEAPKK